MKRNLILAFAATLLIIFSGKQLNAQTKEDAGNAFNAALELSKTDMAGAVVKMQDVLKMCSVVGKDADSLKIKIGKVLSVFQFNTGNSLMKDRKFDAAFQAFEKSVEFATTYADENKIKDKAEALLVKLYGTKAGMLIKTDADSAIMFADKSLKLDPGFAKALFTKGQAYERLRIRWKGQKSCGFLAIFKPYLKSNRTAISFNVNIS